MAEIHCSLERAWLCPRGWSVSRPLGFTSNMPFQAPERSHPLRGTHMKLTWNLSVGKVHWESSLWVLEKIVLKRMSCPASCHTLQEPAERARAHTGTGTKNPLLLRAVPSGTLEEEASRCQLARRNGQEAQTGQCRVSLERRGHRLAN